MKHLIAAVVVWMASALAAAATGPDMALMAGGAFTMGSDSGLADERPPHTITLVPFGSTAGR
jgi:formylglycine-generating enzyme required for sulfatase activity